MDASSLASTYQSMGVYAALAVLTVVVVYLYRRVESLQNGAVEDARKATTEMMRVATESSAAILKCTETLSRLNEKIDSINEDLTALHRRV